MESSTIWLFITLTLSAILNMVTGELKLLLLHTNDMHARFEETNANSGQCPRGSRCYGGFARTKAAVERFKKEAAEEGRSTLFLNAGDTYQGTVYYTMFKWKIVSELINMMGIDVMSLGNHEFDDGPEGLEPFLANSSVPIVCSNIDYSEEPTFADNPHLSKLTPSTVLVVGGVKVGVIGYLTPETEFISKVGGVKLLDEVAEVTKEAQRLKKEGVKVLIALGHSGFSRDKEIAQSVPDLDLVVGGHTNTFLYNGAAPDSEEAEGPYPVVVTQASGRKVPVLQAYAYTKYLGYLKVTFDDEGEVVDSVGNPVLLNDSFRKDGEVERAVLKYGNEVKEMSGRKIGFSSVYLEADALTCRIRECNFGNLVTDALVEANAKDHVGSGWTDAPIAMIQGGALRTSISHDHNGGIISYSDLLTTMPFQNTIERLTFKGSVLREVLEHSVARYSTVERVGAFMQYSGVKVEYDLSKPPQQRVVSASVRCGVCAVPQYYPLEQDHEYRVLTSSFLATGGDGYSMLKAVKKRMTLSFTDQDAVESYLGRMSPVHPEVSGRIRLLDAPSPRTTGSGGLSAGVSWVLLTTMVVGATTAC